MDNMIEKFVDAIQQRRKIKLTFYSKQDKGSLVRLTAPLDFAPSTLAKNKQDRFHFWDYESDEINHTLSLLPEQILKMEVSEATFDPSEFINWRPKWKVKRDWGEFS